MVILLIYLCYYYNDKIVKKYVIMNTPKQVKLPNICTFDNVPSIEIESLAKCKMINGIQTYRYRIQDYEYMISTAKTFYFKACSGFCVSGTSTTGNCKEPSEQKSLNDCETLIKPKENCVASTKPIGSVKEGSNILYYYINGPINSLNLCS